MSVPEPIGTLAPTGATSERLNDDVASALAAVAAWVTDTAFLCDSEGVIQGCNGPAETLFGYSRSEVVGRKLAELIPGGLGGLSLNGDATSRTSAKGTGSASQAVMTEAARKDATTFPIELSLSRLFADGGPIGVIFLVIVRHMGRKENAKRELRDARSEFERRVAEFEDTRARLESQASEAIGMAGEVELAREATEYERIRVKAVLEVVGDVIVATDGNGVINTVNSAITTMFGYRADEVAGQPLSMLIPELSGDGGGGVTSADVTAECEARRKSGKAFPVELAVTEFRIGRERCRMAAIRDITERKAVEAMVRKLALTDPLTGLSNRNLFNRRLKDALNAAQRLDSQVAVMLLDLNDFKSINDNFGHLVGDALLIEVAKHLERSVRAVDTVARLGGDEFAIIVTNIENVQLVETVAKRVVKGISRQMTIEGCLVEPGVSIGISTYPQDDTDPEALVRLADRALCEAKAEGRGAYRYYDPGVERASRAKILLEYDMRLALVRGEFEIHYQPQVDLLRRELIGAEALVRWRHPAGRLIPPGEFIPAAESSGLIVDIGEWVLRETCRQNKAWQDIGLPPIRVAVNISARQIQSDGLVESVEAALRDSGLDPKWLELEITEGTILIDSDHVRKSIDRLDDLGVALAV
ncbi:MAG: diguanylate cyclase, partial [Proteobacteria bacterium]|nr:diguanylate cyclase [Pseudomonadota bacterium]